MRRERKLTIGCCDWSFIVVIVAVCCIIFADVVWLTWWCWPLFCWIDIICCCCCCCWGWLETTIDWFWFTCWCWLTIGVALVTTFSCDWLEFWVAGLGDGCGTIVVVVGAGIGLIDEVGTCDDLGETALRAFLPRPLPPPLPLPLPRPRPEPSPLIMVPSGP